ncbi:MAG: hypothetical protein IJR85_08460 [Synergistaceae bacterium]|nr:hypothetical protein [Synergistaceae bacterium]
MPSINVNIDQGYSQAQQNITANARQGQISTQPQIQQPSQIAARLAGIRTGMVVEGSVLSQNQDGTYLVRVDVNGTSQELRARATLSLIPGEHFRAVWDASGHDGVPVLRLSQGEFSFLSQIPARDREIATALLARGLPLSDEVLSAVRDAWRRAGAEPGELSSFIELWARDVPMTQENAALLSQYAAMNGAEATEMWNRIRKELRERNKSWDDPVKILRDIRNGTDDIAKFLQAQSILMKSPRPEVNPALLAAPYWPLMNDSPHNMTAKVYVGRSGNDDDRKYWQVGFGITGSVLGEVSGLVESDGKSCNLTLSAEKAQTCRILEKRRRELRRELEGSAIPVSFIGISRRAAEEERDVLLAGRGLDITV